MSYECEVIVPIKSLPASVRPVESSNILKLLFQEGVI